MASVGMYYVLMSPGATVDFSLNLSCTDAWLAAGDVISSATWTSLSSMITVTSSSFTDTVASVFLTADDDAEELNTYEVKLKFVTTGGRTDYRHLRVVIWSR